MKKFLSLVLALVMTMSLVTVSAGAKDFTDNSKINYKEAVDVMSAAKVIDGYAEGDFRPANTLTRGAAAKIICNLILGPTTASALVADAAPYSDVAANSTFAGYIAYCQKTGIISGYADGTFRPGNSLTGYAFMKMLLGALGYESANEGYVGKNWSINVAKRALNIGLDDDLKGDFNGVKAVTREEACLYAFNTLKATMVEYDTQTIVINNGQVSTNKVAKDMANTARVETIKDDNKMQFAEKYFSDLKQTKTEADDFGRPAHEWKYKKDVIGLYTETPDVVYTDGVKGKEIREDLGADYDVEAYYVNSAKATDMSKNATLKKFAVAKNNSVEIGGKGTLTEVYVIDNGDKDDTLVITCIDTYLAQATADYSKKNEELKLKVWNKAPKANEELATTAKTVALEDVAGIEGFKEDDFVLVTMADGVVKTVEPAEVKEDVTVTTFSTNDGTSQSSGVKLTKVTFGGTKYDANVNAYYDNELANYSIEKIDDTNFNVIFDKYGYVIGIEAVDADDQYVFVTSVKMGSEYLAKAINTANVIYTDGTMKTVDFKLKNSFKSDFNKDFLANGAEGNKTVNTWFNYTMDGDTLVLESVVDKQLKDTTTKAISSKSTTLAQDSTSVYKFGNSKSVYIAAEVDDDNKAWITDVNGVYTGIKNVDIDTSATEGVAYAMYNKNGYVTYAVVVGDDAASNDNYVYILSTNIVDKTYVNKDTGYVYTYDCLTKGATEKGTVQVVKDVATTLEGNTLYKVFFDANGYGKKVEKIDSISTAKLNTQYLKDNTVYGRYNKTMNFTVKGGTMYVFDSNNNASYVILDDACTFWVKNKDEANGGNNAWECFTDVDEALAELGDAGKTLDNGTFAVIADKDTGYAVTVIFYDTAYDKDSTGNKKDDTTDEDITVEIADGVITVTAPADAKVDAKAAAIVDALDAKGFTDIKVNVEKSAISSVEGTKNSITYNFEVKNVEASAKV